MVKLFDTQSETLKPLSENKITIYNCGPTVYNHIHIGNARPLVTFDVLYRLLQWLGKEVVYVLNITDIDDKIIKAAAEEQIPELTLSEKYFQEYRKVKQQLNTLEMTNPKVSDHIPEIIAYIEKLVQQGNAYVVDGDVYFDTTSVPNYGQLSKRKPEELLDGARVEVNKNKRHPSDFVLWKKTNVGINWTTQWSVGRPGWHTECALLINKLIGDHATIHGGGMDLKFPHHENENAQNWAMFGRSLADIWLHIGLININQQKMSKSLNNFILVKDILQDYPYQVLRWFFYQGGISAPLNYSKEQMDLMQAEIDRISHTITVARTTFILNGVELVIDAKAMDAKLLQALENNLNFPNAVTVIQALNKRLNQELKQKNWPAAIHTFSELINGLQILGIEFPNKHTAEVRSQILRWQERNAAKDYATSDQIRKELKEFF